VVVLAGGARFAAAPRHGKVVVLADGARGFVFADRVRFAAALRRPKDVATPRRGKRRLRMATSLSSFEKKEKDVLLNFARSVGSALGTVAAKTSVVTKPANRRKAVRTAKARVKKQVAKAGAKVKKQVNKARGKAKKAVRKVETSARKVRRKI
jgi:hypothetical protein